MAKCLEQGGAAERLEKMQLPWMKAQGPGENSEHLPVAALYRCHAEGKISLHSHNHLP